MKAIKILLGLLYAIVLIPKGLRYMKKNSKKLDYSHAQIMRDDLFK